MSTTTSAAIVVISACSSLPDRDNNMFRTATRIPTAAILNISSTSIFPPVYSDKHDSYNKPRGAANAYVHSFV